MVTVALFGAHAPPVALVYKWGGTTFFTIPAPLRKVIAMTSLLFKLKIISSRRFMHIALKPLTQHSNFN
jgi:hypothetical protein